MLENTFLDMTPQRSVRFKILYDYAMHRDSRTSKISNFKTQDGELICTEAFRGNRCYCEVRPFGSFVVSSFRGDILNFFTTRTDCSDVCNEVLILCITNLQV